MEDLPLDVTKNFGQIFQCEEGGEDSQRLDQNFVLASQVDEI